MVFVEDELFHEFLAELDLLKVKFSFLVNSIYLRFVCFAAPLFTINFADERFPVSVSICFQLEILQRQVSNLADSQNNVDDRTSRTKTEHAVLQARYHMLEEQLREVSSHSPSSWSVLVLTHYPFWLG